MQHLRLVVFLFSLLGTVVGGAFWVLSQFYNDPTRTLIEQTLHMSDVSIVYTVIYSVAVIATLILSTIIAIVMIEKLGIHLTITREKKEKTTDQQVSPRSVESGSWIVRNGKPLQLTVTYTAEDELLMKLGYQTRVRQELQQIEGQLNDRNPKPIHFKSWNEMELSRKEQLIDNPTVYRTVQNIAKLLNEWNKDLDRASLLKLEPDSRLYLYIQSCRKEYAKLREIGFLDGPIKVEVLPKRETLQRGLDELSVLNEAQGYYPSTTSTFSISNLKKLDHQKVLEICRDLGARELLEVKEMNEHALVRITSRGQQALKEAG